MGVTFSTKTAVTVTGVGYYNDNGGNEFLTAHEVGVFPGDGASGANLPIDIHFTERRSAATRSFADNILGGYVVRDATFVRSASWC